MQKKFHFDMFIVSIFTTLLGVIFSILLILGIGVMLDANSMAQANPNNPLAQIPTIFRLASGGGLAFFSLAGLVFCGGVHVLIAIFEKLPEFEERRAQRTVAPMPPLVPNIVSAPAVHARSTPCPQCGAQIDPNSRFCEVCGAAQPAS